MTAGLYCPECDHPTAANGACYRCHPIAGASAPIVALPCEYRTKRQHNPWCPWFQRNTNTPAPAAGAGEATVTDIEPRPVVIASETRESEKLDCGTFPSRADFAYMTELERENATLRAALAASREQLRLATIDQANTEAELAAAREEAERLNRLDVPGHGVARDADYAAAGDHTEGSSWAQRGPDVRAAIDAARGAAQGAG